ncbi:MAG: tetratricopeptide repeat protein [Candidatus Riflebacteria bacterium]|nr:tetratricopeptide repeat protein [Candidatus Riflebacteria bacterium]
MAKFRFLLLAILLTFSATLTASEEVVKKGRALQSAKKFEEALQLYKTALKDNPDEELYVEAASLLGKLQKYDNAETILAKGIESYPKSLSLKNLSGLIKFRKGDREGAKAVFEEVLKLDQTNSFAQKWLESVNKGDSADSTPAGVTSGAETLASTGDDSTSAYNPSAEGAYSVSNALSQEEQNELAVKLYTEMTGLEKWELEQFKELHKQVIERCPLTKQAQESCWRLSNLYLLGEDPPDYNNAIAVLEHLLKQYPDTELMPDAKNRLLVSCQKSGQNEKLVALYEELFTRDPEPADDKVFMVRALEFADALTAVGRTADAQLWYQKVIEKDDGRDQIEARAAKARLEGN